jgi:riboflavin transporter FmnP
MNADVRTEKGAIGHVMSKVLTTVFVLGVWVHLRRNKSSIVSLLAQKQTKLVADIWAYQDYYVASNMRE